LLDLFYELKTLCTAPHSVNAAPRFSTRFVV
jgi:hypothetical protein